MPPVARAMTPTTRDHAADGPRHDADDRRSCRRWLAP